MKKLLLVDDDPHYLQLLSSVLLKDLQTVTATGVADALNVLETTEVDAVCSDFHMRDGTGLELFREIWNRNTQMPCLLMSGNDDRWIRNLAQSYGAVFCSKTDPDLTAKIRRLANPE